jgi:bacillithiol biosynthesis cysteine-adding enzyme BshC
MNVETHEMPLGQHLTEAYTQRTDPGVADLFGYHPAEDSDWRLRAQWLDGNAAKRAEASQMSEFLLRYNRKFGATELTESRIRELGSGALSVVGGQQAGLWSGPLMVIHKAVSIIQAARWAEASLNRPVVPVFWIAGEDHDWDEANHTYAVTGTPELRKLSVTRPAKLRTSVSRTRLAAEQWRSALAELETVLPDSEHKPELIVRLRALTDCSDSLTDQFAHILHWLFGGEGLVLLDADDPELRRLESPMFVKMIQENDRLESAYRRAEQRIDKLGYPLQAESSPGSANLFFFREGANDGVTPLAAGDRVLLYKENGSWTDRKGGLRLSVNDLLDLAETSPERFSNNVLTRPLMQDFVLPVLATVLGPGEISYWAATGEAFGELDMQMPIVVPRMSFTMIDDAVRRSMVSYDLSFEDVRLSFKERREAWLNAQDELSLDHRFEETKRQFAQVYEPLLAMLPSVQPGLGALGKLNQQRVLKEIDYLQQKTKEALGVRFEAGLRRMDRIAVHLWPDGKPQERLLNFSVYWNRYGRNWLDALFAVPYNRSGGHYILYL